MLKRYALSAFAVTAISWIGCAGSVTTPPIPPPPPLENEAYWEFVENCEGTWDRPLAGCPWIEQYLGTLDRYFEELEALNGEPWALE